MQVSEPGAEGVVLPRVLEFMPDQAGEHHGVRRLRGQDDAMQASGGVGICLLRCDDVLATMLDRLAVREGLTAPAERVEIDAQLRAGRATVDGLVRLLGVSRGKRGR